MVGSGSSYPRVIPWCQFDVEGAKFLEVPERGGGCARSALQPDDQRLFVVRGNVRGGVVKPPEHVRVRTYLHVPPFLFTRTKPFPGCWIKAYLIHLALPAALYWLKFIALSFNLFEDFLFLKYITISII